MPNPNCRYLVNDEAKEQRVTIQMILRAIEKILMNRLQKEHRSPKSPNFPSFNLTLQKLNWYRESKDDHKHNKTKNKDVYISMW